MTASLADVADPESARLVFLEEFRVLLDAGLPAGEICRRLDVGPATLATRLRRWGLGELLSRWERRCRAAGLDT